MSRIPSRPRRLSILDFLSKSTTFVGFELPLLASFSACSLCCQQKNAAAPSWSSSTSCNTATTPLLALGDELGELEAAASVLRHGLPLDVIALQVVPGFLESERGSRDSGVCGIKGMWTGTERLWVSRDKR